MIRKILLLLVVFIASLSQLKAQTTTTADTAVYTKVDKVPEFIGGKSNFYKFLGSTTRYPAHAREYNIQGKVELSFIVEIDGSLSAIKIAKSVAPDLDAEAIRVLKRSPKWLPGIKDGKPVRTLHHEPFSFTLAYD